MQRLPIPLILAAVIAVGVTVTIIFQIIILNPPGAVIMLVPQGASSVTYQFEGVGVRYVAFPIGLGSMEIVSNTTNFYYANVTELWSLAVPASKYTNATNTYTVDIGTSTYSINVFDCGNILVMGASDLVYIGQWADFGGFKVAVPINFTGSPDQVTCARKYMYTFNVPSVDIFSPRIDYYVFDGTYIYIYYDRVDTSSYYFRYDRRTYTPIKIYDNAAYTTALLGYKVTDSTGIVYLGQFYVGAFSSGKSGTYAVRVTGR